MRRSGILSARSLLVSACVAGAVLLFAAALTGTKQEAAGEEWLALNGEVRAALDMMETGAGNEKREEMTGAEKSGGAAAENRHEAESGAEAEDKGAEPGAEAMEKGAESEAKAAEEQEGAGVPSPEPPVRSTDGKIDINRATAAELEKLKGIGPAKARAIVEERERGGYFRTVDDLLRVKGIGDKLLAGVKESVVAHP